MANPTPVPAAEKPKRVVVRKTFEQKMAEYNAKIAELKAAEGNKSVIQAVKDGHVSDPKAAKRLAREMVALQRSRSAIIACGWAKGEQVDEQVDKRLQGLKALVRLPAPAAAKAG